MKLTRPAAASVERYLLVQEPIEAVGVGVDRHFGAPPSVFEVNDEVGVERWFGFGFGASVALALCRS